MTVAPYQNSDKNKKQQVEQMFDNIAAKYDFLNHFLSLGIDRLWRKKAVKILREYSPKRILDVATGTGDFAIATSRLNVDEIIGYDLSGEMIRVGEEKVKKLGLDSLIRFQKGDSESMPFEDDSIDAITVAFGVRNFETLQSGLDEFYRVLHHGGVAIILEFSKPKYFPFKQLYKFYFFHILPFVGGLVSKDSSAYTYLPESVMAFPDDQDMLNILSDTGFRQVQQRRLTMGIATIYVAQK
ncbi:bifunctional demethylmenaquinone methyltransferase/2-methoxy-6-polyprenyl-1,4-benzoquinol methylase UbiE [uncultured Sunxiuqinia sp.]|uniref:bifunctional demethylmenaquinone methyltransferase/2-methoxy-6-polyprenyl-1,4-benzoquinol methylase UbiE n=1 Tax=uncultured Sunxiuqinia sp. TaxID=1573825 RepID=UPI002AA8C43B|nr:bifunctional demethylmenaquinone methyltransferase/2-methoxy-6-polyprenyl-1,4-benzoquinol methylase UbiE [uncultured Sunxiuqinia sp.]